MKKLNVLKALGGLTVLCVLFAFTKPQPKTMADEVKVKCLLQTTNYTGEGAYIVVSLVDANENYDKTLYMQGQDEKWYDSLESWWKSIGEKAKGIDAISGATISPGARTIVGFNIPSDKVNAGYKLRFESAVEDKPYYERDIELDLTSENLKGKFDGTGYIRYVRLILN